MRDVLQFLVEFVLALIGAIAGGALIVGAIAFGSGCAMYGCTRWWRGRRRRAAAARDADQP